LGERAYLNIWIFLCSFGPLRNNSVGPRAFVFPGPSREPFNRGRCARLLSSTPCSKKNWYTSSYW